MTEGHRIVPAVFIAVLKDERVLLVKRKNTGFMDGVYDLPSGHVDEGEAIPDAAVRELYEETSLEVKADDLKLLVIGQSEYTPGLPYIYFIFKATRWRGKAKLNEPSEAKEVDFYPLDNLPKTVMHVRKALQNLYTDKIIFERITLTEKEALGQ